MNFPDTKALKKLADMCRKAGIKHYKCADFEFELSDSVPELKTSKRKPSLTDSIDNPFQSDSLTEQQMLFYSVASPAEEN